jgi:hypothetical protein
MATAANVPVDCGVMLDLLHSSWLIWKTYVAATCWRQSHT